MKIHFLNFKAIFALTVSAMLSIFSQSFAATYYWDGATPAGAPGGGAGTWDTSTTNWDTSLAGGDLAWSNDIFDTAIFGGTAGTVTLGSNISVGGLRFNTTGYTISAGANTLSFSDTNNSILFNNIAAATITGAVGGTGNVSLSASNPATAGTLTLNGTSTSGWTGTTIINSGMTLALSGLNQGLLSTSGITLNGGGITLTNADSDTERILDRVSDTAGITSNGGTITYTNTTAASTRVFAETIGSVTLNRGQLNLVQTLDKTAGSQTLALAGLSQSGTSAITFSNAAGLNTTNDIIRVNGITSSTTAGQIIGPWATVGTTAALQTDYAVYNSDGVNGRVVGAAIGGTTQDLWTTPANAYTMSANQTLTGTRTITALRNATGAGGTLTLATGANLETYGLLTGGQTLSVNVGTGGVLTTPTGGGNLFITTGGANITVTAPINNNGGNVTLVKSGSSTLTLSSTTSNYSGGTVVNAGTLTITADSNLGATSGDLTFNGNVGLSMNTGTALTFGAGRTITVNEGAFVTMTSGNGGKTFQGVLEGSGTLFANHSTDFIFSNAANTFTGAIQSATAGSTGYGLGFASIGDTAGAGLIHLVGGSGTFRWLSASGSTTTLANRQFAITGTGSGMISALGTTAASNLVINKDLLIPGAAAARTLTLGGTNTGNNTFAGVIANGTDGGASVVSLTKAEASLWLLTGANTYTGTTTISAGTLQLGAGGTTGSLSPSSAIVNNATLTFNRSDALVQGTDFATVISGSGAVIKLGAGDLTYSGANTYTGTTKVSNGKILMTNALALQNSAYDTAGSNGTTIGLDVTNGLSSSTLTLGGLSGAVNLASAITAGYTGSVTNLTLNPQSAKSNTYTGIIANATTGMTLTKTGLGTQLLHGNNSYSGGTILNAGTIEINNANSLGSGTITFAGTASINPTHSSNPTLANGIQVNSAAVGTLYVDNQFFNMTFTGPVTGSGTLIQANGAGGATGSVTLSNTANTFTGILQLAAPSGKTSSLTVNSLADSANPIRFTSSTATALGNNFILGAGTATPLLFNSRQIELASASGTAGIYNNNGAPSNTITINTNLLITANGAKTLLLGGSNTGANTFAGTIGNSGAGATSFTKADAGLWLLSGANTYTGVTTVSGGILAFSGNANVASGNPLGQSSAAAGNLLLANGTTLKYVGSAASIDRSFTLNVASNNNGASLDASGTGAINFTNTASPAYGTVAQPRTLTLTGTNTSNNTLAANLADNTSGAVSINKTGIGTWVLTGTNANTGATTISGGGKLILDYSTNDNSKIAGLTLNNGGGDITLSGGSHLEAVTSTSMTTGGGHTHISREVGSTAILALGAISRSQSGGFTTSFAADNLATTTTANFTGRGMLGGGITVGSNWAKNDGSGNIVALTGVDYTALPTGATTGTANYELSSSQTHTGSSSMNSLRIVGTGITDQSLDLGANQLQVGTVTGAGTIGNSGGLLYAGGGTNNFTITGTSFIQGQNANQELIIHTHTGNLTLDLAVNTGSVGGGAGLTKSGAGTLILTKASSYASATYINQGALQLRNNTASGTTAGGIFVANNAALEMANGISVGAEALSLTGVGVSSGGALRNISGTNSYAGAITLGAGGARINSDASGALTLTGGVVTSSFNNVTFGGAGNATVSTAAISGAGGLVKDGDGTTILAAANTYTGATTISAGTLQIGAGAGTGALSSSSAITNNATLAFNRTGTMTQGTDFANNIRGTGSVNQISNGTLIFNAANSYTGTTTVTLGTLKLNRSAADNSTIVTDGSTDTTSDIVINGGILEIAASEQIANTGSINMSSGAFNFGSATGKTETIDKFTNSGGIFSTGANTLIGLGATVTWSGGTNTVNAGGSVQDAHLVISGGTNTVEGGVTGGVLQLNAGGDGLEMSNGATLTLNSDNSVAGKLLLKGNVSSSGDSTVTIGNSGSNTYKGTVDLDGGTRTFIVADGSDTTDMLISAVIANGSLTKEGLGTLTLTGTNTYTGATTINNGILQLSGSGSINGSDVTVNGGSFINNSSVAYTGTLTLNNASLGGGTIDGDITYSGGGTVSGSSTVTGSVGSSSGSFSVQSGANLTVGTGLNVSGTAELILASTASVTGSINYSSSVNSTIEGVIAGSSETLTKSGNSTLTLTGSNTYTGATNVDAGKLVVNGNISSSSLTSVASGATIGGSGTVGELTVSSGGFINPGNSPGILNVSGDYTQAGLYTAEITGLTAGTEHDQINVTGSVDITGGSLTALFTAGTYAANDIIFILLNDGVDAITGTYSGLAQEATVIEYDGFDWKISYTANSTTNSFTGGNDIALMAIPEPKAALLGGIGLLLLLRRRR